MGQSTNISGLEQRIEQQFGLSRGILLAVGVACLLLGGTLRDAAVHTVRFILTTDRPVALGIRCVQGELNCCSACDRKPPVSAVAGNRASGGHRRGDGPGAAESLEGLGPAGDWCLRAALSARGTRSDGHGAPLADTAQPAAGVLVSGLVTLGISIVILLNLVADPLRWAGVFVGLKLLMFGATLAGSRWALKVGLVAALRSRCTRTRNGELYAVYFGTAFHLGVYIGNGEIVHYLNDNYVYRVTWEKFLENRIPQHWTYPDLPPVPVATVAETAISEVGKTYPYSLLRFNCENFAIFCKSGGTTRSSKYAQIASGVETVQAHPVIGLVAELNTLTVEWLAFHFGGPAGKQLSLAIRRIGAAVTNWLLDVGRAE